MTIQTGTFEVNTTVLFDHGRAWIVDPGAEAPRILELLAKRSLTPQAIFLTHAHFDHIGAVAEIVSAFPELPVYVDPADAAVIDHPANQLPPDYPAQRRPKCLRDPSSGVDFPVELKVIKTPGHTPGGVCYHLPTEKLLLAGDTLFAGSVGRTDLPGGDMATLMASLERLKELPRETEVIPGHGMFTTVGRELDGNPFLS